jgi:hypothetical protein
VEISVLSFWRLPLLLALMCSLLVGAALLIPRVLPAPPDDSVIGRNLCALPCFFGVLPGITTDTDAFTALSQYVDFTDVSDFLLTFPLVDYEGRTSIVSVNFDASLEPRVASVRATAVDIFTNIGQFGDLLLAGQKPNHVFHTCAYVLPVRFLVTFGEYDELLVELFPRGDLAPDTSITLFDLSAVGSRSLYDARSSFGCTVESGWLGFAPLWKYFAVSPSS